MKRLLLLTTLLCSGLLFAQGPGLNCSGGVFNCGMPSGTAAAPGAPFASDRTTGWFTPGTGQIRLSISGSARYYWDQGVFQPLIDATSGLGAAANRWTTGFFQTVEAGTTGTTGALNVGGNFFWSTPAAEPSTGSTVCIVGTEVYSNAAATCTVSSLQLKNWVEDITCTEADRIVKSMHPATFQDKSGADGPRFGFAAEWTVPVDPRLVYYDKGKPHAVDYERYSAVLTKYLQCQPQIVKGWLRRIF